MKKTFATICFAIAAIGIQAAGHTVTVTGTNPSCFGGCNGSASASVAGGVGPFTYAWAPSGGTGATAPGLCAGTYTVTVTDMSDMSTAAATVTINNPPVLNVTFSGGSVCGAGSCTTLTPTGTGGTPPYTYSWSGGLFGPTPTACPGSTTTYTVTITDSYGCVTSTSAAVVVITPPTVTVPPSTTYCAGATVPAGVFSSTPAGASYTWTNSNTSIGLAASGTGSVPSFTAMGSGIATITVTPTYAGCVGPSNSYTITVNPAPTVTLPSTYSVCPGSVVCLSASTSAGSPVYSWSPAATLSSSTTANPCAAPVATTTYTLTVSDGTCSGTATTTVIVNGPITPNESWMDASACGVCDGSATVSPMGGTPAYIYLWNDPSAQTSATATGLCAGGYTVTITDASGCTATASVTVDAANSAEANFTAVPDSATTDLINFFNSSTGGGLSYNWDFADGVVSSVMSPSHLFVGVGTYNVSLIVTSSVCGDADTLYQTIVITGSAPATCLSMFNIADDTTTTDPNALYVYNLSYGAALTYLWDFGDATTSTLATPAHTYSGTGPYTLCLTVNNGSGCTDTYCDVLTQVDSINRSGLSIQVFNPDFPALVTGMNDQDPEQVGIYPNPFSEATVFRIEGNGTHRFELTDVLGKTVMSRHNITGKQFSISREGLENGVYFYKIMNSEKVVGMGKLVIR